MTEEEYIPMTLTTEMACTLPHVTSKLINQMEEKYLERGRDFETFRECFCDKIWELPGWSNAIRNIEVFFSRAIAVLDRSMKEGVKLSRIVNEERAILTAARISEDFGFPFYCVGKRMLEAAQQTKPFTEWDFNALPLPFPCVTFLLPKGTRIGGELITHFTVMHAKGATADSIVFMGANGSLIPFIAVHPFHESGKFDVAAASGNSRDDLNQSGQPTREIALSIMQLVLNLVGIMHARKELVSGGGLLREVGKGDRRKGVYKAHVLGQSYTYKTVEAGAEPGASGRPVAQHWRRGHWHTVCHGKGKLLRRLEWFEPTLVGKPA
jgi:hypothetical protein